MNAETNESVVQQLQVKLTELTETLTARDAEVQQLQSKLREANEDRSNLAKDAMRWRDRFCKVQYIGVPLEMVCAEVCPQSCFCNTEAERMDLIKGAMIMSLARIFQRISPEQALWEMLRERKTG